MPLNFILITTVELRLGKKLFIPSTPVSLLWYSGLFIQCSLMTNKDVFAVILFVLQFLKTYPPPLRVSVKVTPTCTLSPTLM